MTDALFRIRHTSLAEILGDLNTLFLRFQGSPVKNIIVQILSTDLGRRKNSIQAFFDKLTSLALDVLCLRLLEINESGAETRLVFLPFDF